MLGLVRPSNPSRPILYYKALVSTFIQDSASTDAWFGVAPWRASTPNPSTRVCQGPEEPSHFKVQVATAPSDGRSALLESVAIIQTWQGSTLVLRTNHVIPFGRWHPARWIHTNGISPSARTLGSSSPPAQAPLLGVRTLAQGGNPPRSRFPVSIPPR